MVKCCNQTNYVQRWPISSVSTPFIVKWYLCLASYPEWPGYKDNSEPWSSPNYYISHRSVYTLLLLTLLCAVSTRVAAWPWETFWRNSWSVSTYYTRASRCVDVQTAEGSRNVSAAWLSTFIFCVFSLCGDFCAIRVSKDYAWQARQFVKTQLRCRSPMWIFTTLFRFELSNSHDLCMFRWSMFSSIFSS